MTLRDLNVGEKAVIVKVRGRGAFRKRITEMGFVTGKEIELIKRAPLNDPVEYKVMDYNVLLRNSEAELIEIITKEEADLIEKRQLKINKSDFCKKDRPGFGKRHQMGFQRGHNFITNSKIENTAIKLRKTINVALVGNPNSGKTTIFNYASGARERVGNYSGVTVNSKVAFLKYKDYTFKFVDLPGTYSISAYSPEEIYVKDYILENLPDIILNVIDASNIERNLYLTTQLIDMDLKVIAALNMYDELEEKKDRFNYKLLGKMTGIPFVPTIGSKGKGITNLLDKIINLYNDKNKTYRHVHIKYGVDIENNISKIQDEIYQNNRSLTDRISSRFLSIKLIEKDDSINKYIDKCENKKQIYDTAKSSIKKIEKIYKDDSESIITDLKYGYIAGALKETYKPNEKRKPNKSIKIDKIITHKILSIPIFLLFMYMTFFFTFKIGAYPMSWIENLVSWISNILSASLPTSIFKDLLIDGIIGGVGGVIVFLPNIIILYFFISIMEDTGYMARAVFIMDKSMHKIGLHGKSFIPLLMGFGCNVPAIMSTRIIESKRDRLLTMLIIPFMSCSARLPIYILFISAFFVSKHVLILFSLYIIGIIMGIITAIILNNTFFKNIDTPFVMELPPYRTPTVRSLLKHIWFNTEQYLKKIGGVILIATIIIWALGYFPRNNDISEEYMKEIADVTVSYNNKIQSADKTNNISIEKLNKEKILKIRTLEHQKKLLLNSKSYIGKLGMFINPVMEPLGFNWKMSVAVLAGISAKEIVVSTLGVLYQSDSDDEKSLIDRLQSKKSSVENDNSEESFTPLRAFVFMLFILLYFPCVGVVAAIKKETGKWKWAIFEVLYTTSLAWIVSFTVYQIGLLF